LFAAVRSAGGSPDRVCCVSPYAPELPFETNRKDNRSNKVPGPGGPDEAPRSDHPRNEAGGSPNRPDKRWARDWPGMVSETSLLSFPPKGKVRTGPPERNENSRVPRPSVGILPEYPRHHTVTRILPGYPVPTDDILPGSRHPADEITVFPPAWKARERRAEHHTTKP
jgi:hypothetical protein